MRGRMVLRTIRMTIGTLRMATSRWHWLIDGSQITSARGVDDPSGVESPPRSRGMIRHDVLSRRNQLCRARMPVRRRLAR
jgi:hypothetical protein